MYLLGNNIWFVTILSLPLIFSNILISTLLITGFGQAHFFHAYYYQYKAGKIGREFLFKAFLGMSIYFSIFYFIPDYTLLFGMLLFVLHAYMDATRLTGGNHNYLSIIILFGVFLLVLMLGSPSVSLNTLFSVAGICMLLSFFDVNRKASMHLVLPFFTGATMMYLLIPVPYIVIFAVSIISHYALWMLYLFLRNKDLRKRFLFDVSMFSIVFIGMAIVSTFFSDFIVINTLFYSVSAYVFWTTIHIFTSFRIDFNNKIHFFRKLLNE